MTDIRPFNVEIHDDHITDLVTRLRNTRWPNQETVTDWSQGVPLAYMHSLAEHWATAYDFQRLPSRLNSHPNFLTKIDGIDIHFLHIRSSNDDATPLLLTHGWPGSIVEFLNVIGPLSEPQQFNADPSDAFHLVIPSLPGFGFSGKPTTTGWGVEKIGEVWSQLMARLGYERYVAQGGDWGSVVTTAIARQDPQHCAAIHLNMVVVPPDAGATDLTDLEKSALAGLKFYQDWDSGYSKQQSTRPQTLGYGLVDSPSGLAAWIVEKFWAWSDHDGHPEDVISRDELLDNIMVYWINAAAASSARLYWESFGGSGKANPIDTPMGATIFPKEIFRTSERFAKAMFPNIIYWSVKDRGGHFSAFEQPTVFTEEVRNCFRQVQL